MFKAAVLHHKSLNQKSKLTCISSFESKKTCNVSRKPGVDENMHENQFCCPLQRFTDWNPINGFTDSIDTVKTQ